METSGVLATTAAFTLLAFFALWLLGLLRRDVSIVDLYWGPGFAAIAVLAASLADGAAPARRWLVVALAMLWGLRLGGYLTWRNWGEDEDARYAAMRRQHGERFAWVSLGTVFGLQALLQWFVSLPLQVAVLAPKPPELTLLDVAGVALFALGLGFESIGDWQLARFKADPANRGRVMDRGLWRYTRHPNYFGDFCVWWGFFAIALATPYGAWTLLSPVVMSFLLLRVSGVALLERTIAKRRPAYRDYVRRTSAFFPLRPRPSGDGPRDA